MAIALYGATGYTGRLVTAELVRRGLDFVLGGRDEPKLRALSEEVGGGAPVRAAALDDPAALRGLLEDRRIVINCAGPFSLLAEPVVRAAVETGTHYVDSTGEQTFIREVFERHGPEAERRGVALIPALAFDYVPGDCVARIAAEGREPLEELVVAYSVQGFSMTRGTMRSGLEMMRGGDVVYEDGRWRAAPGGVVRASFDFPEPIGRQPVARYPAGEVITVPRHTRTRRVRALISLRTVAPHPALVPVLPYLMPGMALSLRTPLRRALDAAIGRLPEGPSEVDRRAARFTVVAAARGGDGSERRVVARGSDPYGLTAVTLVHGAELILAEGFDRAGALGPAAAFEPRAFLEYLGGHGLSWEPAPALAGRAKAAVGST